MKVFIWHLWNNIHADIRGQVSLQERETEDTQHVYLNNIEITHTQQWIQGVITAIYPTTSTPMGMKENLSDVPESFMIIIDDGTSVIGVCSQHTQCHMPNGKIHTFFQGDYVMAVGTIVLQDPYESDSNHNTNRSKRRKFRNVFIEAEYCLYLGADPNLETLWATEVILNMNAQLADIDVDTGKGSENHG